jgi:hypothetical protein
MLEGTYNRTFEIPEWLKFIRAILPLLAPLFSVLVSVLGWIYSRICPPRQVAHNLPNAKPPPIGRDGKLWELRKYLSPASYSTVCVLRGFAGMGKTHLAVFIAYEHLRRAQSRPECLRDVFRRVFRRLPLGFFDAIIYIAGKAEFMTLPGMRHRRPLKRLPEITAEIARVLGDSDLRRLPPRERERSVLEALKRRRTLLILDGLEEMEPEVLDFIRRVPDPSRVLIASRHAVNSWPEVNLEALDPESARRLIRREAKQRGRELTNQEVEELVQNTGGNPLAIVISIARLASGTPMEELGEELRAGRGDLAEYMVERSVETLRREDSDAYRLFRALALFDPEAGAHREALGDAAGLPPVLREAGLRRLEQLSLIEFVEDESSVPEARPGPSRRPRGSRPHTAARCRFLHPLIHARAVQALEEDPEALDFRRRWIEWYQVRLAERPQNIRLLRAERPNLVRVLQVLRQEGRMEELARFLWNAVIILDEGRRIFPEIPSAPSGDRYPWDAAVRPAEDPAELYLESVRELLRWALKHGRGDLLTGLVWDIFFRGGSAWEREFTEQWWELLRPLLSASEETALQVEVLWQRLVYRKARRGEISREEARAAMEKAFQALKPERSEVEAEQAISVCNSLGFLLMDDRLWQPDYPSARAWLERGLELLKQHWDRLRDPKEWEAVLRGNLALLIARAEGRYGEAMRTLEEIRPYLRWDRDLAEWHLVMAVYAYRRCRICKARRYGREGEAILRRTGEERLHTREGEEWERIRARLNRPPGWIREQLLCLLRRINLISA